MEHIFLIVTSFMGKHKLNWIILMQSKNRRGKNWVNLCACRNIQHQPRHYRNCPKLQLVKTDKAVSLMFEQIQGICFQQTLHKPVQHSISVSSPLSTCSSLLSCPFTSPLRSALAILFCSSLHFLFPSLLFLSSQLSVECLPE